MAITGKSEIRVDAFDKATGRTKYYDDLAPSDALIVRVKHSTIAHGFVKSIDPEERTLEYYRTRPCVRFVETAATVLEQMLAE